MNNVINTQAELINFASKLKAPLTVTIKTKTLVKMNKKDVATKTVANPFSNIYKIQELEVVLNGDYQGSVNNQRLVEGSQTDFEAKGLQWGEAENNVIITNNSQFYLKTIVNKKLGKTVYVNGSDETVDYNDFAQFVPAPSTKSRQGVEEQVIVRTFKLDSIIEINFGKLKYIG